MQFVQIPFEFPSLYLPKAHKTHDLRLPEVLPIGHVAQAAAGLAVGIWPWGHVLQDKELEEDVYFPSAHEAHDAVAGSCAKNPGKQATHEAMPEEPSCPLVDLPGTQEEHRELPVESLGV